MSNIPSISTASSPQSGQALFVPPVLPTSLTFTLPQLAGSMARAAATSAVPPPVLSGFAQAFTAMLNTLVEPQYSDLTFLTDIEDLADSMRTAFSGAFGAGMADLYMGHLGYTFRCNGRELAATGRVFDLAYDLGSPGGAVLVAAVEAKGSIRGGATLAAIRNDAQGGYSNQVAPHLGNTLKGVTVAHGYAVGTGSQIKRGVCCEMHVQETKWTSVVAGATPPPGALPVPVPAPSPIPNGGGGGPPPIVTQRPHARVAIANYRDAFRLLGTYEVLRVLNLTLREDWKSIGNLKPVYLERVEWRGSDYVVAPKNSDGGRRGGRPLFGLREDVAIAVLGGVSAIVRDGKMPVQAPEIPTRPLTLVQELLLRDGGAEFPDGLAYFGGGGSVTPLSAGLHWVPLQGAPVSE